MTERSSPTPPSRALAPRLLARLSPRAKTWLLRAAICFGLYLVVGFLVLPPILRWQLEKRLPALTHRHATVREVRINPLALSLTLRGLSLTEPDGRTFASWDELHVNLQASSILRWGWAFHEVRLVKPFGEILLLPDGRLNFSDLLPTAPATNPPAPARAGSVPRLFITHLLVTNGFVALEDRTRRSLFRTEYRPINLNLHEFTTRPDAETPYSFHAESDAGRSVSWAGDITIQPLRSSGRLEVTGVSLGRYQPYLEDFTRAVLTEGTADLQVNYLASLGTNGLDLVATNGSLQIAQLRITDPSNREAVGTLGGLSITGAVFNLRERTLHLGSVSASEASVLARLGRDRIPNWSQLLLPPPASPPPQSNPQTPSQPPGSWTASLDRFTLDKTRLTFEDLSLESPFKTELAPIEVRIDNLSTRSNAAASYSFRLTSEVQEAFEGRGTLTLQPPGSSGTLKIAALDVRKYLPYVESIFRGKVLSGRFETEIPYHLQLIDGHPAASVTNLSMRLADLEVRLPESPETITHLTEVRLDQVSANLQNQSARVGGFRADGGSLLVRRDRQGSLNWFGLLKSAPPKNTAGPVPNPPTAPNPPQAGAVSHPPAAAQAVWAVELVDLQLLNYTVKLEDQLPDPPAVFLLDQVSLHLRDFGSVGNPTLQAEAGFRLNSSGTVRVKGTGRLDPPEADLELDLGQIDLKTAQPYLTPLTALRLESGLLSTTGKLRFQSQNPASPRLAFSGKVQLSRLVTRETTDSRDLARLEDLTLSGIEASFEPTRLHAAELRLTRPGIHVALETNGQVNLLNLTKTAPPSASSGTNAAPAAAPGLIPVSLDALVLDQGSLKFSDTSIQPPIELGIDGLQGTLRGLSTTGSVPVQVDLQGRFDKLSPFAVSGRISPLASPLSADLSITNTDTQLTPLTGYLEKYGGHPLLKGRLTTRLHYRVDNGKLQAENRIEVDQLTLGARNNSPDATSLPLRLGVALLKDSNGRIELDLPVSGDLTDPKFRLGPVIFQVIGNVLVKAAASPFKLLGSLVGGGGDELNFVAFQPGSTNVVEGEWDKLSKLASALGKRPALSVEIEGAIDPVTDRDALARSTLLEQLESMRTRELAAKTRSRSAALNPTGPLPPLEPEERTRLLRLAFVEQFGTNVAEVVSAQLARLPSTNSIATPPSSRPRKSLMERATSLIHREDRSLRKAEKQLDRADREALGLATPEIMESLLIEKISVPEEALRKLMDARARTVQDWLASQGQIGTDRLLRVAPKPVDASYRGESRVSLSLN